MKVLILGGTGPCGILTCRYALQAGHQLVIYARNPSKLPKGMYPIFYRSRTEPVLLAAQYTDITAHDDVQVVAGELTNLAALRSALEGCNAVISSIGPLPSQEPGLVVTNAYKVILEAMRAQGVKRIIALGTPSIVDPVDPRGILAWLLPFLIKLAMPGLYKDIVAVGALFRQTEDIDWTVVRVPFLTNKPGTAVNAGYVGDGKVGWVLRRDAYAWFVMDELEKGEWVKRMPAISNA